jgi:hypothetical protein
MLLSLYQSPAIKSREIVKSIKKVLKKMKEYGMIKTGGTAWKNDRSDFLI